eukprot:g7886.t1
MGYSGDYSVYARCCSEFISTLMYCFLLGCLLANKLLPKTKASDFTFGWVGFGIGLAVFAPTQFLGHISASFNPATTLGAAVAGDIDWLDVPFYVICQFLGAFLGTVLVWLFYLPTFETDPEPAPSEEDDRLLHTRDDLNATALNFVSYSTRPESAVPPSGAGIRDFRRLLSGTRSEPNDNKEHLKVVNVCDRSASGTGPSLCRSVSVAYVNRRLQVLDGNTSLRRRWSINPADEAENTPPASEITVDMDAYMRDRRTSTAASVELGPVPEERSLRMNLDPETYDSVKETEKDTSNEDRSNDEVSSKQPRARKSILERVTNTAKKLINSVKADTTEVDPKLVASLIADQNMKLSIFCTRPVQYLPISNIINEVIAVFFLEIGILLLKERSELFNDGSELYLDGLFAFYIGIYSAVLTLCFGGMGIAMNPARDVASRFAHWILPINGKGKSEWYYAWITIVGPLMGGALGALAFLAMKELNKY